MQRGIYPFRKLGDKMTKLIQKETLRHREAFEFYYKLGDTRDLPAVSQKFGVSIPTAKRWSKSFGWQKRIQDRDRKNAEKLAKRNDESIVERQARNLKIIRDAIQGYLDSIWGLKEVECPHCKKKYEIQIIKTKPGYTDIDKLIRLESFLLGEPESRGEHIIRPMDWKPISTMTDKEALEEFKGHLEYFKREFGESIP